MKVTMLTKRVTVNVISHRASHALEEFLNTQECEGCDVLSAQITLVTSPVDALKKTLEFVRETDTPVLGYAAIEHLDVADAEERGYRVWIVSADLEQAIDFTKPEVEEPGVMGAGLESGATAPVMPTVYERDGGWWFRGTADDEYGPYRNESEASTERTKYLQWVEDGRPV